MKIIIVGAGQVGFHIASRPAYENKDVVVVDDLIYFISEEAGPGNILKAFNRRIKPIKRAMIVGGGRIGIRLAESLEKQSIYTKLIEWSAERCAEIAEQATDRIKAL